MKLNENREYPVEYEFTAGNLNLWWQNDFVSLDKQDRHALLKILKEMALED